MSLVELANYYYIPGGEGNSCNWGHNIQLLLWSGTFNFCYYCFVEYKLRAKYCNKALNW